MDRRAAILLALLAGIVAMAAPILVALQIAKRQSLQSHVAQCDAISAEILRRSESTAKQFFSAYQRLRKPIGLSRAQTATSR